MAEMLQILRIRMSDEDMQAIFAESKRLGLTPSAWARMQLKRILSGAGDSVFVLQPNHSVAKVGDVMKISNGLEKGDAK